MMTFLHQKINILEEVTSYHQRRFHKKNIFTIKDLIFFFPKTYEDRRKITTIHQEMQELMQQKKSAPQQIITIIAKCIRKNSFHFKGREVKNYTFHDGEDFFFVPCYNPFQKFKIDENYFLTGKLVTKKNEYQLQVKEFEIFNEEKNSLNTARITPIYSSTEGLTQKKIRAAIKESFNLIKDNDEVIDYNLPQKIMTQYQLKSKLNDLLTIHFPENEKEQKISYSNLVYEHFFQIQYNLLENKKNLISGKEKNRYPSHEEYKILIEKLPFRLTGDQKKALQDITEDMSSVYAMNRVIQGDVGCGKTIVALLSMYFCHTNQHQSVLLAPTEILAKQHFSSFQKILNPFGVEVVLLYSSLASIPKKEVIEQIKSKKSLIIISTHAILNEAIEFLDLKYVVIDEQHRFGVEQREKLLSKGFKVDICNMSATPIPRSLSMIIFGDSDISRIKQLPNPKKEIKTKLVTEEERNHCYRFLINRIEKGEQAYIIYPLIKEGEREDVKSLEKEYQKLQKEFSKIKISSSDKKRTINLNFIHGKSDNKNEVMEKFYRGEIDILLSTTVVEVGIDNPNVSTILIESCEQFGLSQLHQLRGRVGRGKTLGFCYLIVKENLEEKTLLRLQKFEKIQDGFEIARIDLEMRGPGEFLGYRQSGTPQLLIGDLVKDYQILTRARQDAKEIVWTKVH